MKTFELHRDEDPTGVSGTGLVAEGVLFEDGRVVTRWLTKHATTVQYDSIEDVQAIHGHVGKTRIVWTGNPFERAMQDAMQDFFENSPFGCVGGLAKRKAMEAPKWVSPREVDRYLAGYRQAAKEMFGPDWETVPFGWAPAITIGGPEVTPPDSTPSGAYGPLESIQSRSREEQFP